MCCWPTFPPSSDRSMSSWVKSIGEIIEYDKTFRPLRSMILPSQGTFVSNLEIKYGQFHIQDRSCHFRFQTSEGTGASGFPDLCGASDFGPAGRRHVVQKR